MPQPLEQIGSTSPSGAAPPGPPPGDFPPVVVLRERFPDIALNPRDTVVRGKPVGTITVTLPPDRLDEVMAFLRSDPRTAFDMLAELTCVDYLTFPDIRPARLGVTYGLLSTAHNRRLWIKAFVSVDRPNLPTMTKLWAAANWFEREVFDMFGVVFDGHPDLRRILTAPGMKHYPAAEGLSADGAGRAGIAADYTKGRCVTRDERRNFKFQIANFKLAIESPGSMAFCSIANLKFAI